MNNLRRLCALNLSAHNGLRLCALKVIAHNGLRLCALGLPVIAGGLFAVAPAAAQFSLRTGALGGSLGSRTIGRPLGGFTPGYANPRSNRNGAARTPLFGYPYTYSVWVPDYYDYLNSQAQNAAPYGYAQQYGPAPDQSAVASGPQQPVIINQYFSAPGPTQVNPPGANVPGVDSPAANGPTVNDTINDSNARAPGDPIGSPQNYYLIAYKDHEVFPALAYWVEDKTLHYVTTQNTHNQASLDLIDLPLTKSLNQRNDVPFTIPGH
jgi:hypothetical protein